MDLCHKWFSDGAKFGGNPAQTGSESDRNKSDANKEAVVVKDKDKDKDKDSVLAQMFASLKKDVLARARAVQLVEVEKQREEKIITEWKGNVTNMLESLAQRTDAHGQGDGVGMVETSAVGVSSPLEEKPCLFSLMSESNRSSNRHWDAQCAAACATAFIMANYGKGREPEPEQQQQGLTGQADASVKATLPSFASLCRLTDPDGAEIANLADQLGQIHVCKKKLGLRVLADDSDQDAQWRKSVLGLRLAFCGRIVVVPIGQPPTFLKTKIHVPSEFFTNLGFVAYVVPIMSQPTVDVACKNPIFVPAWSIRADKKKANMKLGSLKLVICFQDQKIDIELPTLQVDPEFLDHTDSYVKEKKDKDSDVAISYFALDALARPLTELEMQEDETKEKVRTAKTESRKRKAADLTMQFEGGVDKDGNEVDPEDAADIQINIDSNLLRHIIR